jgi:hypothetical protein
MTKYLLPCTRCGAQHEVQQTQAGEKLSCQCGEVLEIPSFRGFRELKPVAPQVPSQAVRRPASDLPRRLVLVAGMLLIAIGLVVGAYGGLLRTGIYVPERPSSDDPKVDAAIDDLSPTEAFEAWVNFRDQGLGNYRVPYRFMAEWTKGYYTRFFFTGLGMIGVGVLLVGVTMCWPAGPTGRHSPQPDPKS